MPWSALTVRLLDLVFSTLYKSPKLKVLNASEPIGNILGLIFISVESVSLYIYALDCKIITKLYASTPTGILKRMKHISMP